MLHNHDLKNCETPIQQLSTRVKQRTKKAKEERVSDLNMTGFGLLRIDIKGLCNRLMILSPYVDTQLEFPHPECLISE